MSESQHSIENDQSLGSLPRELVENIRSVNPWWTGGQMLRPPAFRRWPFARLLQSLKQGIAPVTVLRGPRRVGKTILLRQTIQTSLDDGVAAQRILYVPFDELPTWRGITEPILAISRWFELNVLGESLVQAANQNRPAYFFFDEFQNLDAWAPQIKNLVDNHGVRALVTGSSSLRIETGRDSLAGRLTTIDIGTLLLREIAELRFGHVEAALWPANGQGDLTAPAFWHEANERNRASRKIRLEAFEAFSRLGGYPFAHQTPEPAWPEVSDYLVETVIRRVLEHDVPASIRGRGVDPGLIEGVFRLACRYAGQAPGPAAFVPDIRATLGQSHDWAAIRRALKLLDSTLLLRLVEPMELRLKRQTGPAKLCLCDHALRAAWLQEFIPLDAGGLSANPHLSDLAGRLAESTLGYALASIPNLDIAHFPMRGAEPEVDFIVTIGTKRIPIEVKYRTRIDPLEDTRGLRAFLEKSVYNAPFGILVTLEDEVKIPDPRIIPISLSSFLWTR